jgi:hypothetical protein
MTKPREEVSRNMDPFVATIIKQSGVVVAGFLGVGLLVALAFGLYSYLQLQHALTLNSIPAALP